MSQHILVVDDDQSFRFLLEEALRKEGYIVTSAAGGEEALRLFAERDYAVVTLDVKMPGRDGFAVLEDMRRIKPEQPVVMITAYGAEKIAIEALNKGAYDYFTKPFDIDTLRLVIRRAGERSRLGEENRRLREELGKKYRFDEIVGESGRMLEVFSLMKKVAGTDVTVLLLGESGTGKELAARAIHAASSRHPGPFIKVNCAAIAEGLLESELFGHEKGAFTDAGYRKVGRFEAAHTGTIFLDEIGDMSLATQAKILRVLQEKEFERVGSSQSLKVDVRVVAATNKDLTQAVAAGEFRQDLYYRINVVSINLPALRSRAEDIPKLSEHFIARFNLEFHKEIRSISLEAMELLMKYSWPGNVRELENVLQRAVVLAEQDMITLQELPFYIRCIEREVKVDIEEIDFSKSLGTTVREILSDVEKQLILKALRKTNWNRGQTAKLLKISRKSLFNKMKRCHLSDEE